MSVSVMDSGSYFCTLLQTIPAFYQIGMKYDIIDGKSENSYIRTDEHIFTIWHLPDLYCFLLCFDKILYTGGQCTLISMNFLGLAR